MKWALLVGIDRYPRASDRLRGAAADVERMKGRLVGNHGFDGTSIRMLRDEAATREAIVRELGWLVSSASAGDVCVFHYSGHGSVRPDLDGDDKDGSDECLCPVDYEIAGKIADDELGALYARAPVGCRLTLIMDCCHSGGSQLAGGPANVTFRKIEASSEERRAIAAAKLRYDADRNAFVSRVLARSPGATVAELQRLSKEAYQEFAATRVRPRPHIHHLNSLLVAACEPKKLSAEAVLDGKPQGVLTYHLLQAMGDLGPSAAAGQVFARAASLLLSAGFTQRPQLEGEAAAMGLPLFG